MRPVPAGHTNVYTIITGPAHSAHAYGNDGVHVVATPALIGFIEQACAAALHPFLDRGEGTVGVTVNVEHVGAAPAGAEVRALGVVERIDGNRVTFVAEARCGDRLLMKGTHARAVVDMARFFRRLGIEPGPAART